MTRWEYRVSIYKNWAGARLKTEHEEDLNTLGWDGWELVGMAAASTVLTMVFKRPVEEKRAARKQAHGWPDW